MVLTYEMKSSALKYRLYLLVVPYLSAKSDFIELIYPCFTAVVRPTPSLNPKEKLTYTFNASEFTYSGKIVITLRCLMNSIRSVTSADNFCDVTNTLPYLFGTISSPPYTLNSFSSAKNPASIISAL